MAGMIAWPRHVMVAILRVLVNSANKRKAPVRSRCPNSPPIACRSTSAASNELEAAGVRDDLLAGAGRAVPPERRADPQGPGLFRRVRRPRRRLLRQGSASGTCGRSSASIASCAWPSWAPATSDWRSPTTRASARKASRSSRCSTPPTTRSATSREAACRSTTSASCGRSARREHIDIAVIAVPAESAQPVRRPGGRGRHQGRPQLLARDAEGARRT